ncbi:MAG: PIN domain-containing protein [Acidimicrobiia bacterium]|nr:PIN domain-containing protein [Acidimicrobiia bacterium]
MLTYIDTSVLVRAYLPDEVGHLEAVALLADVDRVHVSMGWTRIEATSALARAARARGGDLAGLLGALDADLAAGGPVMLLRADPEQLERATLDIVIEHGLRSLDALHLAGAQFAAVPLLEPGEQLGFASRGQEQASAAAAMGFAVI